VANPAFIQSAISADLSGGTIVSSLSVAYTTQNLTAGAFDAGFNISGNYISDNWGKGIVYEISYNAQIENNTLGALGGAAYGSRTAACAC
jgi:parallel beta-helix repeat protein